MAANSGVKIIRDFFRESPCRMAYVVAQRSNAPRPVTRMNHLRKLPATARSDSLRPKTAPILSSNLAQTMTSHNLLREVQLLKRPSTSAKVTRSRRDLTRKNNGKPPVHLPAEVPRQRSRRTVREKAPHNRSPGASSEDLRRKQQHHKLKPQDPNRKPPHKPCKICTDENHRWLTSKQWQDLVNASTQRKPPTSSEAFRHQIAEIEKIRAQVVSREGSRKSNLRESLELMSEIKQLLDGQVSTSGTGSSYLSRLEPFHTTTLLCSPSKLKAKKSVRSVRFEGGRIIGGSLLMPKKSQLARTKPILRGCIKPNPIKVDKKFDEGPLRTLLPYLEASMAERRVQF